VGDTTFRRKNNSSMDMSSVSGEAEMVDTKKKEKERGKISSLVSTINPFLDGETSLTQLSSDLVKREERKERDNDMVEIVVEEGKVVFTKMKKEDEL
jgi:hypothetical protein